MKQVKILFLCLIGFLSTFYSVNAQSNAGITTVGSATACPGDTITIPINLSGANGGVTVVSGFSLDIYYDASVLSAFQYGNNSTFVSFVNATTFGTVSSPFQYWAFAQTTKSSGVKQIKLGWSSGDGSGYQLDTDVNGIAHLCDVQFRYLGGTTALTFDNSSQGGGNCQYSDYTGTALIDNPTSTYYFGGTISPGAAPSVPSAITGNATPCIGSYLYSIINDPTIKNYAWTNTANFDGISGGVFLSTNNGGNWNSSNEGMTITGSVNAFAISGTNIFAGTANGMYLSTNNGSTWTAINNGLTNTYVLSIAISGVNIYAGTQGGVFLSTNNGANWTAMNTGLTNTYDTYIQTLIISGSNIFAGTNSGMFVYNGTIWVSINNTATGVIDNNIHATLLNGTTVFEGSNGGMYKTTNNGTTWIAINTGLSTAQVNALAMISGTPNTFFAGTNMGVYKSTNNGSTWFAASTGLTSIYVKALTINGTNIFAGTDNGMFLSTNNGANWSAVNTGLSSTNIYALAASGTNIFVGTPPVNSITYNVSGTATAGTISVTATNGCGTTAASTLSITSIGFPSTAATSASASLSPICPLSPTTLSVTGGTLGDGANWYWYTGSCGGTLVGSTMTTLVVSPAANTTYYVNAIGTCGSTTCVQTTVNVNSISVAPTSMTATASSVCPGGSTTLGITGGSLVTNAMWMWYSVSCGGTPEGNGSTLIVTMSVTTNYYVRAEGTCNTTTCVNLQIALNINSVPPTSATASDTTICGGASTVLSFIGGSLGTSAAWNWYSGSCSGTSEGNGASLTVSPTVTTNYYVEAAGTCNTTTCSNVTINVNDNSIAASSITAVPTAICLGSSTALTLTGGSLGTAATWQWYSGSCVGGTSEGNGNNITVSPVANTTYYVRAEGLCNTTTCVNIAITVNDSSIAATSATASAAIVCSGTSTTLGVTGGTLGTSAMWVWYSGNCGGTSTGNGVSLAVTPTISTTYYVRAEGICNSTPCANVAITVNDNSVAATSASATPSTFCIGNPTVLSVTGGTLGTGASWNWYSASCGVGNVGNGASLTITPGFTTSFYVRAEGTCGTTPCVYVTATVNDSSSLGTSVSAGPAAVCPGNSSNLNVIGGTLGTSAAWTWYNGSCGGGSSIGNASNLLVTPTATTTYYVRAEGLCNTTNCLNVTVTLNDNSIAANAATIVTNPICSGSSTTLGFTGGTLGTNATWQWYTVGCGTISAGAGTSLVISPVVSTTLYVRAEGTCNSTTCVSATITVNTLSVAAASATATPSTITTPASSTLSITGGTIGTGGGNWYWYTGSCGGTLVATNATTVVTPSHPIYYWVRAESVCNTTTCVSVYLDVINGINSNETTDFSVSNYPNPFNNLTTIEFVLPQSGLVTIDIYNVLGEHIMNVANTNFTEGKHQVSFDGTKLQDGVYPYKVKVSVNNKVYTKTKMMNIVR